MALVLYGDECVDARVIAGLRQRAVDILTVGDDGLLGSPDHVLLDLACELGRAVVTSDHDFLRIVHQRWEDGEAHPGLLFLLPRAPVGVCVRGVATLERVLSPGDLRGRIEWIG